MVDSLGVRADTDHLGRHPGVRARRTHPLRIVHLPGQAKVRDLQRLLLQMIVLDGLVDEDVGGLEVAVYDRHGRLVVQIVHAARYLDRPVDKDIGWDLSGQYPVQAATSGVLHHQAELRLQADTAEGGDILVFQGPEEFRLLEDIVAHPLHIILARLVRYLDGHLLAVVEAAMHLTEATGADHLLDVQLLVLDLVRLDVSDGGWYVQLEGILVGDKVLGKDTHLGSRRNMRERFHIDSLTGSLSSGVLIAI